MGREVGPVVDEDGRDVAAAVCESDSANDLASSAWRQAIGTARRTIAASAEVSRVWSRWWNISVASTVVSLLRPGRVVRRRGGWGAAERDLDRVGVAAREIGQREGDLAALDGHVAVERDLRAVGSLAAAVGDAAGADVGGRGDHRRRALDLHRHAPEHLF